MNGNDTYLDVNNSHLRVTSGNVYATAFNLDQISIVASANTVSTVNFNNDTKAFNAVSNIEVGTANLFVDTTTSRVGIGTDAPAYTLDVHGSANVGVITTTDINVTGNLAVLGTSTIVDTDNLRVKDPIIELGKDNTASPIVDLGLILTRPTSSSNVAIIFDESTDKLEIGYTQGNASQASIAVETAAANPISVNVNGTISGNGSGLTALNATNIASGTLDAARIPTLNQNTTGSAGSAATLTTPRSIDGVNFDGSADIVLPVPTTFGAATFSGDVAFDTDTLKIDSTNNRVGIGTASPSANLHVVGNVYVSDSLDGNMMIEGTGLNYSSYLDLKNTSRSEVVTETGGWYRIRSYGTSARNGDLAIEQMSIDGTSVQGERLTINNIGNVGIGTTSPSHLLNVKATSGDAEVHIQAQGNDGGDAILYFNGASTNQRKCAIISSNVAPNSYCKQDLHFCMETTGDLSDVDITDSKMVLTNAGNVGIGTSSFVDTRNVGGLHIQNSRGISFQVDTTQTDSRNWRLRSDDYGDWGSLQFSVSDDNSTGPDAADEVVMTMTKERNVGIGTTSPNASLHIDGSLINTAKIQLLQKLVTITGGNNQLHAIQQGMQLYAGDGRSDWQNYQFASDSQWLIGLLGTDMVNGGSASNADMTISCKCDVTAFLISNTSGWNGVTMTGWNSLGTVASIMDGYTSTFEIWAKTLSAGTHSFDTYSAMYAFTI